MNWHGYIVAVLAKIQQIDRAVRLTITGSTRLINPVNESYEDTVKSDVFPLFFGFNFLWYSFHDKELIIEPMMLDESKVNRRYINRFLTITTLLLANSYIINVTIKYFYCYSKIFKFKLPFSFINSEN